LNEKGLAWDKTEKGRFHEDYFSLVKILVKGEKEDLTVISVTNFIRPYLHQFFDDSHGLNGYRKPMKRPFDRYQSHLKVISIGRDIRQINW